MAPLAELRHGPPVGRADGRITDDGEPDDTDTDTENEIAEERAVSERT
jgi:hypothetical protein